eukprot:5497414-Amphidinium_carterae.1
MLKTSVKNDEMHGKHKSFDEKSFTQLLYWSTFGSRSGSSFKVFGGFRGVASRSASIFDLLDLNPDLDHWSRSRPRGRDLDLHLGGRDLDLDVQT